MSSLDNLLYDTYNLSQKAVDIFWDKAWSKLCFGLGSTLTKQIKESNTHNYSEAAPDTQGQNSTLLYKSCADIWRTTEYENID